MPNHKHNDPIVPEPDNEAGADAYAGPERRHGLEDKRTTAEVRFDAKGNPVWEIRSDIPRRRQDDDTLDLLKCLDNDTLSLEDDVESRDGAAFDPYDTADD